MQMVRVIVRRIMVGWLLRCSEDFSCGVGLEGEAVRVSFLLLMTKNGSISGE